MKRNLPAAALRVGDEIYARGQYVTVVRIQYATPREGRITLTTSVGKMPDVSGAARVSLAKLS